MNTEMVTSIATIVTIVSAVIAVTSMFVTLRERVGEHANRLNQHSIEIRRIDLAVSESRSEFATIREMITGIKESIDDMKRRGCP